MAKFCIHCGRKLEDGEVCHCQVQKREHDLYFLDFLKGIFVKPIDTIKKYTNEKYLNLSLILIMVFVLSFSLFILSFISNMAYSFLGNSLFVSYIPYFQIFIMMIFGGMFYSLIYVGFLYLVNSVIFKGEKNFKKIVILYGVCSIILSVGLLISSILMFINGVLGIIFLSFGSVLNMIYLYNGIQYLGVKDKNKHGYIYLCTVAFCILFFVILSLFLGMISNKDRYGNNYIRENSNYYDDGNWYYN